MRRVDLAYASVAEPGLDRPAHVRAGSGLVWNQERLMVVQDDANFLALVDTESGQCDMIAMPAGKGGRRQFDRVTGNKKDKYDFEALVRVPTGSRDLVLALGSGSSPTRENIAVVEPGSRDVRIIHVPAFYDGLRAESHFAGSDMNIEGAVFLGTQLRLFGRGNGAARDGMLPVDATCDVDVSTLLAHLQDTKTAPPRPCNVVQFELGTIGAGRLGFTDARLLSRDDSIERIAYLAAAEASSDATSDGDVTGSAIGIITSEGGNTIARWTVIKDERGAPLSAKAEGLEFSRTDPNTAFVVLDADAHDQPSQLCEVRLDGFEWAS